MHGSCINCEAVYVKYVGKSRDGFWCVHEFQNITVGREVFWGVMTFSVVSGVLLEGVKSFHVNSKACVRAGNCASNSFAV